MGFADDVCGVGLMSSWTTVVESMLREESSKINEVLSLRDLTRESLIKIGREIVRSSGYVITYIHSGMWEEAEKNLRELREAYSKLREVLSKHPCYEFTNMVIDYLSEYAEAVIFYNLVKHRKLVLSEELGIDCVPYVLGLLDVVGELKRFVLTLLSTKRSLSEAIEFFKLMEIIYEHLRHLDYPDAILPNARRKIDVARGVIESLRYLLVEVSFKEHYSTQT
ncbi:MAG: haloacid dehalogenase [Zestosphaera sp.]